MKRNILMSIALTTSIAFASDANLTKEHNVTEGNVTIAPIVKEGVGYIKTVGKMLKSNMKKHMLADKSGVEAVAFCSSQASEITKEASQTFPKGVRVYRTSTKVRNPNNKPDATDLEVLNFLEKEIEEKSFKKKPIVKKLENNTTRVYVPLLVEKVCTKCHGNTHKINPEINKIINTQYPQDKAINYKEGDLRGVIVAEMPNK